MKLFKCHSTIFFDLINACYNHGKFHIIWKLLLKWVPSYLMSCYKLLAAETSREGCFLMFRSETYQFSNTLYEFVKKRVFNSKVYNSLLLKLVMALKGHLSLVCLIFSKENPLMSVFVSYQLCNYQKLCLSAENWFWQDTGWGSFYPSICRKILQIVDLKLKAVSLCGS